MLRQTPTSPAARLCAQTHRMGERTASIQPGATSTLTLTLILTLAPPLNLASALTLTLTLPLTLGITLTLTLALPPVLTPTTTLSLDPLDYLVRTSLGCPCPVVRHTLGVCLPPSPLSLMVGPKGGAPPPLTLHPLMQEVKARKARKPLAASQVGHHGRPWETCELALAAWCLLHIMPMG